MEEKTYLYSFLLGCVFLILGIIITIILVLVEDDEETKEKEKPDGDWNQYDCYVFSIFWPPSSCFNKYSDNEVCFNRTKDLEIENSFIIHGLWPNYISGKYLDTCNTNEEIDIIFDDGKYINQLRKYWPGLYSSDQIMWNHEYNKHGYCYIERIGKDEEKDYKIYFDQVLDIFKGYRLLMEEILPDIPQGLYNVSKSKFKKFLLQSSLKLDPSTYYLRCSKNDTKKTDVLNEIRFNYDLNFTLTNAMKSDENCPENFQIYFSDTNKKAIYEKYDFYVLTLFWNPSLCKEEGKSCYKKIKGKELNIFTIHGLWPSYQNGQIPQWCNIGEDIQIDSFPEELNESMNNYWYGTFYPDQELWSIEYNKHGYCYIKKIGKNVTEYNDYFQKTIDLYNNYDGKNLFKEFYPGIFAGNNKLNKTYINEKLDKKFGKGTYALTCLNYGDKYYLKEIRLKLDMEFNLTTKGQTPDNCPEEIYAEFIEVEGPGKQAVGFYETYDMYFFTILWLGTTCHMKGEQCYDNIESIPKNIFTLHGLWPNYRNGTLPDWCNGKNDIEIEIQDKNLSEFMNTHYISGYHTNQYFWGHEYNKHGYCYNQRNNLDVNDYEAYFQKAKEIFIEYDLDKIFLDIYKDRITLGDMEINRSEVEKYFDEKGLSKDTYLLVCTNITQPSTQVNPHLLEIRIRFDLDFKLLKNETDISEFDCPEIFYAQFL